MFCMSSFPGEHGVCSRGWGGWQGCQCLSLLCSPAVAQPFFCKPFGVLYSLPYLREQPSKASEVLSRSEWWELLFFVKKLEAQGQKEIICLIQQDQGEQVWGRACSGQMGGREEESEATDPRG